METFGSRITKLRERCGISRESLAGLIGISASALESCEIGYIEPSIETLYRIAQIFGVSEAYAAMLTDEPEVSEDDSVREIYIASSVHESGKILKSDIVGTAYINREDMHGREYFAYLAPDDKMSRARISKGDMLIIKKQSFAENNSIAAVILEGKTLVRRYTRKGNLVTLTEECPRGEKCVIDTTETLLQILGQVVEVRIKNL
ncbi:MAG: helix-turn-helix domain-containing protein [Clostridia bacterium]|nr:helix-turn-helix domain-containing protein [Clostridia bacterium]